MICYVKIYTTHDYNSLIQKLISESSAMEFFPHVYHSFTVVLMQFGETQH